MDERPQDEQPQDEQPLDERPYARDDVQGHILLQPLALPLALRVSAVVTGGIDVGVEELEIVHEALPRTR